MITIDEKAEIVPGCVLYNPAENVRYKVIDLTVDKELRSPVASLLPLPPFGTSKNEFRISIGSIIALGYLLEDSGGYQLL